MQAPIKKHKGFDPLGDCGKGKCPVCARNNSLLKAKPKFKEEFTSDAVAPFIGRFGYPNINVGILAPPQPEEESWLFDAPKYWATKSYDIPRIVDFRSSLLNSRHILNVKNNEKLLEITQDIAMASNPVDIDVTLKEKPRFRLTIDSHMAPTGPNAPLKRAELTQNPKIHTKVYKVYDDTDLKAADAVNYLYKHNFDENFLSKILSVGTLGIKTSRKLVPTRWSITATDDTIGKNLINEVKDFQQLGTHYAFFGNYLGNYYLLLFFPEPWSYELFETYAPPNCRFNQPLRHTTDHETYTGRKTYANNTVGGYYTVRLAILEKLKKMRRQASVLALRFITDEYSMPLGVWVTRESARKAVANKATEFSSKELMFDYAKKLVKNKFNYNVDFILEKSVLIREIGTQKKLKSYLQ